MNEPFLPAVMVDYAEQDTAIPSELHFDVCPKCGGPTTYGYGLAGGGIGAYTVCLGDTCDWMGKVQDAGDGSGGTSNG